MWRPAAEFEVDPRALNAESKKGIIRLKVGKTVGRQVVRRTFLRTWKRVRRVAYERLEGMEAIARDVCGDE
jgi:hypothetical protein